MKNYFVSLAATVCFGPFGVMYSSVIAGLLLVPVMFFLALVGPQVFLLGWLACTLIGQFMTAAHNSDEALKREQLAEMAKIVAATKSGLKDG